MKWFKHYTDSTSCDYIATVEVQYGMAGYGRLFKMKELISSQMIVKESDPKLTLPTKKWAMLLGFKQNKLISFFDDLAKQNIIKLKQTENHITVIFPKLRESLDNRAASSANRGSSDDPYENREDQIEEKKLEEKKSVSSSNSFFLKLDRVLKGSNVKEDLDHLLITYYGNQEKTVQVDSVVEKIERYFENQKSEGSQKLGSYLLYRSRNLISSITFLKRIPQEIRPDYKVAIDVVDNLKKRLEKDLIHQKCNMRLKDRTFSKEDLGYIKLKNYLKDKHVHQDWYDKYDSILRDKLQ